MNGWIEGIQNAIRYIEENITEELGIREIAEKVYVSAFHFQRMFSALCGFTVGEYIRNRRLSLAAQELSKADVKVIDVAVKYGYCSPDSLPARSPGSRAFLLRPPMKVQTEIICTGQIKISIEGGTMLEYKIVEKEQFTVMGKART